MPVLLGYLLLFVGAVGPPSRARHFIRVAIIAIFHHIVDTHPFVAIIIIVGLPHGAVRIDGNFIIVSEVLSQDFKFTEIKVGAKDQTLFVIFRGYFLSCHIFNGISLSIFYLHTFVAEIEVKFAVGTENKSVHAVVMLLALNALKNYLLFVCFIIAIRVCKKPNIGALGNNRFITHYPYP